MSRSASEREQIVAWLRRRQKAHEGAFSHALHVGHEGHVDLYAAMSRALEEATDAIERGDHLKEQP